MGLGHTRDRSLTGGSTPNSDAAQSDAVGIFASTGEFWSITYGGATFSLRDVKGLTYIQRLLQHPGEEFHSLDLLHGPENISASADLDNEVVAQLRERTDVSVRAMGDAGELLDQEAKVAYKRRMTELREQLEDLRERGNHERSREVGEEIKFLEREIVRAVGLGGRDRRAGSDAERARLNVTRAVKAALQRIAQHHAPLAQLLDSSIRTGLFCAYIPDRQNPVNWQFSTDGIHALLQSEGTAPVLRRAEAGVFHAIVKRTTFVGREAERESLRRLLERTRGGSGGVVMIGGAPGVGKTRIAAEIGAEASSQGSIVLSGASYDRADSVPFIPFVEMLEAALAQAPSLAAFRTVLGDTAPEMARLMPQLRRLFPDIAAPLELPPAQSRRALFGAAVDILGRTAKTRPVLLIFEDLHWADEGTLALLNYVARSLAGSPVMIIGTYRVHEVDPGGFLAKTLDELMRLRLVERMTLGGLSQNDVAEMIQALSGLQPPESAAAFIRSNTEGNPFFIEELLKHLAERGKLIDSRGEFRRDLATDAIDLPPNLRLMIGTRVTRLSEQTRKVLCSAALTGRSFTFELLEAATELDADALLDRLEEAERAGLLFSTLQYPEARFHFSHELIRQAVAEDLSAARRQRLHLRIAAAIERLYPDSLEGHVDDLAHHMLQAGAAADPGKTIGYLVMAARQAMIRSANYEAMRYYRAALQVVKTLPESSARDRNELELHLGYLPVVLPTREWTTEEAGAACARALELCERLGETSRMFRILRRLSVFHMGRAEHRVAHGFAMQMLDLAKRDGRQEWLLSASAQMGAMLYHLGDLRRAHEYLSEALSYPSTPEGAPRQTMRIDALSVDGEALWMLGYADLSRERRKEALTLAKSSTVPTDLALALTHAHMLSFFSRDFEAAIEYANQGLKVCAEKKFEFLETSLAWSRNNVRIFMGLDDDIEKLKKAFVTYHEIGTNLHLAANCMFLARCCGILQRPDLGLEMIDESIAATEKTEQRTWEAETWRVKGELTLQNAVHSRVFNEGLRAAKSEAEQHFRKAIEIARRQGTKIFELRAIVSLVRLLSRSEQGRAVGAMLAEAYGWFTEGMDTPDLKEAKALLDELSSRLGSAGGKAALR
jgi:tetratricopeptide (TPR) repeat protein